MIDIALTRYGRYYLGTNPKLRNPVSLRSIDWVYPVCLAVSLASAAISVSLLLKKLL